MSHLSGDSLSGLPRKHEILLGSCNYFFPSQRKHPTAVHGDNLEFTSFYFLKSKSFENLGDLTVISYNLLKIYLTSNPDISVESYYQRPSSNQGASKLLQRGQGQIVNIFNMVGHTVFVATIQFFLCGTKTPLEDA